MDGKDDGVLSRERWEWLNLASGFCRAATAGLISEFDPTIRVTYSVTAEPQVEPNVV